MRNESLRIIKVAMTQDWLNCTDLLSSGLALATRGPLKSDLWHLVAYLPGS